jgi:hypothetical protein
MILDEIGSFLAAEGVATVGTTLFKSLLPDSPDTAMALFETGGLSGQYVLGGLPVDTERPGLQILCRANDYSTARQHAENAYRALDSVNDQALSGVHYHWIQPQQPPFSLGQDERGRLLVAFNVIASKELS